MHLNKQYKLPRACVSTAGTASCDTLGGVNTRNCSCKAGYEGLRCEIDIDECDPNPCERGVCTETTDGVTLMPDSWYCACPLNYIGKRCKTIETLLRLRAPEANVAISTYAILGGISFRLFIIWCFSIDTSGSTSKVPGNGKPSKQWWVVSKFLGGIW